MTYCLFILHSAVALQRPRLRHPGSLIGRRWQRTPGALPRPPDPAAQRVYTHTQIHRNTHTHSWVQFCSHQVSMNHLIMNKSEDIKPSTVMTVNVSQYLGCRSSNTLHRSCLLIGVFTTISSSFTPVSSALLAKYNTKT